MEVNELHDEHEHLLEDVLYSRTFSSVLFFACMEHEKESFERFSILITEFLGKFMRLE